jgi:hypothetical protein
MRCETERPSPRLATRRALGPDLVLAVRVDDDVDDTAPIDVVKSSVADAPPADVEPVERGGDLVALVVHAETPLFRRGPRRLDRGGFGSAASFFMGFPTLIFRSLLPQG